MSGPLWSWETPLPPLSNRTLNKLSEQTKERAQAPKLISNSELEAFFALPIPVAPKLTDEELFAMHPAQVVEYSKLINDKVPADPPGEHSGSFNDAEIDNLFPAAEGGKKFDSGKPDYTLLPFEALEDTVKVLGFGAVKYGRDNWQKVERQRYVAASFRHLVAIAKGEEFDEESGLTHAAHLTCCALFLGRQY